MKVILVFIFCCAIILSDTLAEKDVVCTKGTAKQMDQFVARIMTVGNTGRKFPQNDQQVPQFCNETFTLVNSVKNYIKNCMNNLAKQVSSVLLYTFETQIKSQFCKNKSKRRAELIEAGECANKGNKHFQKCLTNFIDSLLGAKNTDDKLKIPHLCCQYQDIKECVITQGKRVSGCTEKHIESINQFIDSNAGSLINLVCGDYEGGSDKCSSLGPPPKKLITQRRTKSILMPAIDLFNSLPEI